MVDILAGISMLLLVAGLTMPFWGLDDMEAKWIGVPVTLSIIFGLIALAVGA